MTASLGFLGSFFGWLLLDWGVGDLGIGGWVMDRRGKEGRRRGGLRGGG